MKRLARLLILLAGISSASAAVLISSKGTSPDIPPPPLWTFDQLDAETGSYDEIDATTFDIHGESGTIEQGGSFLYQTVTSGNIQIIAEVAAFSGTTVANTAAGVMIRSSLLPNARLAAAHFTADGRTKARSRNTDGGEAVSTALGSSGGLAPQCEALWFNAATSRVTTYENPGPDCSPTVAGWTIVLADNPFNIPAPYFAGLSALSLQPSESVTAQFQQVQLSTTNTIVVDPLPPDPECSDNVDNADPEDTLVDFDGNGGTPDPGCDDADDDSELDGGPTGPPEGEIFTADFETGRITPDGSNPDGFYVKGMGGTVGATPAGPCTNVSGKNGGGELGSTDFTRVVDDSIQEPYSGNYSLRFQVNYNCNYNLLGAGGGTIGGPKDKARTAIQTIGTGGPQNLRFDEPYWVRYAKFFPSDWKPETSNAQASDMPIFEAAMDTDNSAITLAIERKETKHPETGSLDLDGFGVTMFTQSSTSSNSLPDPEATTPRVTFDLRDIMGGWSLWMWRIVMSPDSSPTGRIDLWINGQKIYGANVPIGACQNGNCTGLTWHMTFEGYKGDWKDLRHQPSSIPSNWPIEYGFDALWVGRESLGAGCDDAHPLRIDNCQ